MKKVAGLPEKISGMRPMKVVIEVSRIGRKRSSPALATAFTMPMPSARRRLTVTTSTRLAFTTTPLRAMMPSSEKNTRSVPMM